MDRRGFLAGTLSASAVVLAGPGLATARAATEDDLALANFGASVEYLLKDFYARALEAKVVPSSTATVLKRGRSAATQHARALSELLVGAGDVAPVEEDFAFEWPARTFRTQETMIATGVGVLRAVLGAYQTAAATVTEPSYRVLYASLGASVSQQLGALSGISGRAVVEPFPVAMDLEAASDALDAYLG
jgi:Ferritin-like domain